nr:MAG TPA: hypothetical protein [Bacteriophage sp.]
MPKHETFRATSTPPIRSRTSARVRFHYSVICSQGGMPSCTNGNGTCRKLRPLFNLQIPSEPVSVKDTHPRKEESMKKCLCQVATTTYESSL